MKKMKRILSAIAVGIACIFALTSCGTTFYSEWHEAGAEIEEDNSFKLLTVDEVKQKMDAKESFVIFLGRSDRSSAVSTVSAMQVLADNLSYKGVFYFVNTKDLVAHITDNKEACEKLNVHVLDSTNLIAVCYKEGKVYFDTSWSTKYEDELDRFDISNTNSTNLIAVAQYVIELYPVAKD